MYSVFPSQVLRALTQIDQCIEMLNYWHSYTIAIHHIYQIHPIHLVNGDPNHTIIEKYC